MEITIDGYDDIVFWDVGRKQKPPTAAIHLKGILGFSGSSDELLKLDEKPLFKVGTPKGDYSFDVFYLVRTSQESPQSVRVARAGNYYYLRIDRLLEKLGIDYKARSRFYSVEQIAESPKTFKLVCTKKKEREKRAPRKKARN